MSSISPANVQPADLTLPDAAETGTLGVYQLKRMWARAIARRQGRPITADMRERQLDVMVVHACGLGLEQAATYLGRQAPTFDEFERWIVDTTGGLATERIARINAAVAGCDPPPETKRWLSEIEASEPVFTADDLAFWNEHGYVVLHDAVPAENRAAAAQALWDYLGARADNPDTWYKPNDHGIMVQYFQHAAFEANRRSRRIHKAFA